MMATNDPALEQRRPKGKKRRRHDINTNHLKIYDELKRRNIQAVLLDSAVWICTEDDVVQMLDSLCFGNLDGGIHTAENIKNLLKTIGKDVPGNKSVRLSIDEAFFMAYALNVLTVHALVIDDPKQEEHVPPHVPPQPQAIELDTDSLWQRLQQSRRDFILLYLAYHHFRSKGWIVRTGLQYGADFVLYQRHPALAHSDYSVIILPDCHAGITNHNESKADASSSADQKDAPIIFRPPVNWHDVQIANRLTTQVGKRLLLLHVRQHHEEGEYSTPKCLSTFSVEERIVRRWVPESMRPV